MGLQIEKSLLAPTFYTDWLDRAFKLVYICAVRIFDRAIKPVAFKEIVRS